MIATVTWAPSLVKEIPNGHYNEIREPRQGVMLHYDASGSDAGAMAWFSDLGCNVSYHYLVLDDGGYATIAPLKKRAYHAGYCSPSEPRFTYRDANSAFYGIAAATSGREDVTPLQLLTIAWLTRKLFEVEGWPTLDLWRITSHRAEAVFGPGHPKAGQHGRKSDPEAADLRNPIFSPADVRQLLGRVQP